MTEPSDAAAGPAVDEPFPATAIEAARVLFAGPVDFLLGAASIDGLPVDNVPEAAFAGRSNVGKSSLINAVTGRRSLARTSTDPGRTREVNFFRLGDRGRLVDLPGYGFARAPRRSARRFQDLSRAYLRGRPNLRRVYMLIDARHGVKAGDAQAMDALDQAAVSYQVVLTKADKVRNVSAVEQAVLTAVARRGAAFPRLIVTSAVTGAGLARLRAEIVAALAP